MITLGITGGIGSGKSTVARRLGKKNGARVVFADELARELMEKDSDLREELSRLFGPGIYDENDSLDRTGLAARVFEDREALEQLNRAVHPVVRGETLRRIEEARDEDVQLFVYEAALLFEAGWNHPFDKTILVEAPREARIRRVMERDGASREDVLARMNTQIDPAEARRRADIVLDNSDSEEDLLEKVDALYDSLMKTV